MVKVLHAADLHLDSPFTSLPPQLAKLRREELRELPDRLAELVRARGVQIVLLAGDLFDGERVYPETIERLTAALARMGCPVFISPGNHDFFHPGGVYAKTVWPDNVYIFTTADIRAVELSRLETVVCGAAFTGPSRTDHVLSGLHLPKDGRLLLMVLHGDTTAVNSAYGPVTAEEAAASGLDCLCLGHVHKKLVQDAGTTDCRYPGAPEGRGFDEPGPGGIWLGQLEKGRQEWEFVQVSRREHHTLELNVTNRDPVTVLRRSIPERAKSDLYRIVFTGETARGIDRKGLERTFQEKFCYLEMVDKTTLAGDIWARAGEETLRGLFLKELRTKYDRAVTEEERQQVALAVRYGLAAIEGRDI